MSRDQVFKEKMAKVKAFTFDETVAACFDDMVSRSIPFYDEIHRIIIDIVDRRFQNKASIYDLGCSTGTTFKILSTHLEKRGIEPKFIGVDNSSAMLEKCKEKLTPLHIPHLSLECKDIADVQFEPSELIIMNYTLQFISPEKRLDLLKKIHQALIPGGVFLLAEKIHAKEPEVDQLLTDLYYDFKRRNGYSELEISQKREALENVLVPLTPKQQILQLKEAGFTKIEMLFRWYNFACYIGIK